MTRSLNSIVSFKFKPRSSLIPQIIQSNIVLGDENSAIGFTLHVLFANLTEARILRSYGMLGHMTLYV